MFKKTMSLILSLSLIITQPIFAQGVAQLNLAQYLGQSRPAAIDSFRPTQLRYFSYDNLNDSFRILLDKGDAKDIKDNQLKEQTKELMDYFLIGLTLPNDAFWVNLRPDSPDNIIDPELEKTDLGRILLEADLQLKKDTAGLTSPQTPEGKQYWDKLYKKAEELFGHENITIPTITRPWIVPGEIIVRESGNSAYIYKANLKVMLESDYLTSRGGSRTAPTLDQYAFSDPRLKELNEYSSRIIRETIIPKLTQEVNSSKRYANLRQVYYSLVLSRWFKMRFAGKSGHYADLIDRHNLTNLTAKEPYDKLTYFKQYQGSFAKGEYNLKEPVYTPYGQSIRTYMSGGFDGRGITEAIAGPNTKVVRSPVEQELLNKKNVVFFNDKLEKVNLSQLPMALAASPVTLSGMKNAVLEQVKILEGIVSKYEKLKVEDMMKIFGGIKTKKELKEFLSETMIPNVNGYIEKRNSESKKEPRSGNSKSYNKIYNETMPLISVRETLGLIIKDYRYSASPVDIQKAIDTFRNDVNASLKELSSLKINPEREQEVKLAVEESYAEVEGILKRIEKGIGSRNYFGIILENMPSLKKVYRDFIKKSDEILNKKTNNLSGQKESGWTSLEELAEQLSRELYQAFPPPIVIFKIKLDILLKTFDSVVSAASPVTPEQIKMLAGVAKKGILGYKSKFEEICTPLSDQDKESLKDIDRLLSDDSQNYLQYFYNAAEKLSNMFYNKFTDVNADNKFGDRAREIEKTYLMMMKAIGAIDFLIKQSGSASPVQVNNKVSSSLEKQVGGIDFTGQAMRIGLERMGSFASSALVLPEIADAAAIDLDKEFKQIQLMASSGIRPSDTRILEFEAACYYRGEFSQRLGEITACIQQAHFLDERLGRESSEALRLATILPEVM